MNSTRMFDPVATAPRSVTTTDLLNLFGFLRTRD